MVAEQFATEPLNANPTPPTLYLPPIKDLNSKEIKRIRLDEKVSQVVFAKFLNISPSTVRQWEQGDKHPRGSSLKLLNMVADKGLEALG